MGFQLKKKFFFFDWYSVGIDFLLLQMGGPVPAFLEVCFNNCVHYLLLVA